MIASACLLSARQHLARMCCSDRMSSRSWLAGSVNTSSCERTRACVVLFFCLAPPCKCGGRHGMACVCEAVICMGLSRQNGAERCARPVQGPPKLQTGIFSTIH